MSDVKKKDRTPDPWAEAKERGVYRKDDGGMSATDKAKFQDTSPLVAAARKEKERREAAAKAKATPPSPAPTPAPKKISGVLSDQADAIEFRGKARRRSRRGSDSDFA